MPPTFTLLDVVMLENLRSISASMILMAVGLALSMVAMASTTLTCRSGGSCSMTPAALSGST